MMNSLESLFFRGIVDNYPEWKLTPAVCRFGRKMVARINSYAFPRDLLQVVKPSLFSVMRVSYAYAHYQARLEFDCLVESTSMNFYIECFFLKLDDARNFFRAVYSFRYFSIIFSKTITSFFELLFAKNEGHETDFKLFQITLQAFYS
jgi:hypothetical protein